jgi:TonB family protein
VQVLAAGLPLSGQRLVLMKPLRLVNDMIPRKLWPFLFAFAAPLLSLASTEVHTLRVLPAVPIGAHEQRLWKQPVRNSEFAEVPHTSARSRCEATQPPEALATPNPILEATDPAVKVKVSFIVGTDGRVHSPLILESSGTTEDHSILETVRAWRYRPAMCNGVPTETEGRIEFSSR